MELSIIVPIYNENLVIEDSISKIHNYFDKHFNFEFEIVAVNDGSSDNTSKTLDKIQYKNFRIINNDKNQGKGFSLIKGILVSRGRFILFTDADLSTPISEFAKLYNLIDKNNKIVIGSRSVADSDVQKKQNILRIIMGITFNFLVKKLLKLNYNDTQCGFKLFDRKILEFISKKCTVKGFCIDVEILYIAKLHNYSINEVGIQWINDGRSSVKILRDPILMIIDLLKIKFRKYK